MEFNQTNYSVFEIGAENYAALGLKLRLHLEGEVINTAETHIGYMHKGLEKITENKKYFTIIPYMTRLDNTTPFSLEYPFVLAVEKLNKINVPQRALYLRVIHSEVARIINHVLNIGYIAKAIGLNNILTLSIKLRKQLIDLYRKTLEVKMHDGLICPGGVKLDLSDEYIAALKSFIEKELTLFIQSVDLLLSDNYSFKIRTKEVGVIDFNQTIAWGFSGPCLRASGMDWDLRKTESYGAYADFDFEVPVAKTGDCYSRYWLRLEEIKQSILIINQALIKLPTGEINYYFTVDNEQNNIFNFINLKIDQEGETNAFVESPKGELGVFLVADQTNTPYRCHIKTPSFSHALALNKILPGTSLADMPLIVASLDVSAVNVDK